ncbi:MAG: DUF4112 domain-containing protein [Verrucomicrobiales bacterium]|nr:DUF4112 domain-containing protein [Verrucomicrobiales bacterium]
MASSDSHDPADSDAIAAEIASQAQGLGSVDDLRKLLYEKAKVSRKMSWLLDECIRVPGTSLRFGLDPLLGLIPYGGETVATIFGTMILGEAGKKGLPVGTLARMGGNMIVNAAIGAIPVVGDLFSFWFKSNTRNYHLLNTYLESPDGAEAAGGWWPIVLICGIVGIVFALNVLAWILLGTLFYHLGSTLFEAIT